MTEYAFAIPQRRNNDDIAGCQHEKRQRIVFSHFHSIHCVSVYRVSSVCVCVDVWWVGGLSGPCNKPIITDTFDRTLFAYTKTHKNPVFVLFFFCFRLRTTKQIFDEQISGRTELRASGTQTEQQSGTAVRCSLLHFHLNAPARNVCTASMRLMADACSHSSFLHFAFFTSIAICYFVYGLCLFYGCSKAPKSTTPTSCKKAK